jgi:hypothetical protein
MPPVFWHKRTQTRQTTKSDGLSHIERVAGALAVLCLAMLALLAGKPFFTNASRPQHGISDPSIALEVARSLDDVDFILGEAPSPDREVMRIKQYIDLGFIVSLTGLFLTLAWLLMRQGAWGRVAGPAAMVCAVATAVFDLIEKRAILRILDISLLQTTPAMINAIRSASAATWALAALTLVLLSSLYRRSPLGALLLATAATELYGLHDTRFLVWQIYPALAALLGIAVKLLLWNFRHESSS